MFVYLFDELRPTPEVSFAVRELQCDVCIVITASHNRKEYYGYKINGYDGGQITQDLSSLFTASISNVNPFDVEVNNFDDAVKTGKVSILNQTFDNQYLKKILELDVFKGDFDRNQRIVNTPLHVSAFKLIDQIFKLKGYSDIHYVEE